MPIYEYTCSHCGKTFEEWLKSDDSSATHPCPACGEPSPRVISQTTFILKGGGWYVTEYGSHHDATHEEAEGAASAVGAGETTAAATETPGKDTAPKADDKTPVSGAGTDKAEPKDKAAPADKAPAKTTPQTAAVTPSPKTSGESPSSSATVGNTASAAGA